MEPILEIWEKDHKRGIFCNRTLNLKSIQAIGYDMDYTLVHYKVDEWEGMAYQYLKERLLERGWPLEDLTFDPQWVIRGLVIDKELGNIVKANRFGYVKAATHGTKFLKFHKLRQEYARTLIDLESDRYYFMNTLFSISEGCMYSQLVDLLDEEKIPEVLGYEDLYQTVRRTLDLGHLEGELKEKIKANPERFVELDKDMPLALLDQLRAGKKLLLITNSGWDFARHMMSYAFDQFLPGDMKWRDLFELVVVAARKPGFFSGEGAIFKVTNPEKGLLLPCPGGPKESGTYVGGNAGIVEEYLGLSGEEILYVGDHILSDVQISKSILRWRTALVIRELEREVEAVDHYSDNQKEINRLMEQKEDLENEEGAIKLELQRNTGNYGPQTDRNKEELEEKLEEIREKTKVLDDQIIPLIVEDGAKFNSNWGYLLRAGNDKSRLARQIENYADIYTSRVSNFLYYTPFKYFRSIRGTLPHDQESLAKED